MSHADPSIGVLAEVRLMGGPSHFVGENGRTFCDLPVNHPKPPNNWKCVRCRNSARYRRVAAVVKRLSHPPAMGSMTRGLGVLQQGAKDDEILVLKNKDVPGQPLPGYIPGEAFTFVRGIY